MADSSVFLLLLIKSEVFMSKKRFEQKTVEVRDGKAGTVKFEDSIKTAENEGYELVAVAS